MRFKLIVRPDGRALLTTTEQLTVDQIEVLRGHVNGWERGDTRLAIIPECDVIQVSEVTIDLGPGEPTRVEDEA